MKRAPARSTPSPALPAGSRRLGVASAKARLSEVLRGLGESPVVIHSRGRDVGVLVDVATYARIAGAERPCAGGAAFLAAVAALRERFGEGALGFAPAAADLTPREPFPSERRR